MSDWTKERHDAVRAACEAPRTKANNPYYEVERVDQDDGSIFYDVNMVYQGGDLGTEIDRLCTFRDDENKRAKYDAEFLAQACTELPAALDRIEEQDKRVAELEADNKNVRFNSAGLAAICEEHMKRIKILEAAAAPGEKS